jgi:hypothetical protein
VDGVRRGHRDERAPAIWTPSRAVFLVLLATGAVLAFNYLDDDSRLPPQKTARTAIDQAATRTLLARSTAFSSIAQN